MRQLDDGTIVLDYVEFNVFGKPIRIFVESEEEREAHFWPCIVAVVCVTAMIIHQLCLV